MFADINLRELAGITAPERSFLSLYLSGPESVDELDRSFERLRKVLSREGSEKDERVQFDENVKMVRKYLEQHPFESGSLCMFAGWILDYFKAFPLNVPVQDLIWIDSSPYIRPLAELQDEYENVAVVVADARKAKVFIVSSARATSEEEVKGNVKNHVKKGGWSQQRYERRRDKQLLHYAGEIVDVLTGIAKKERFRRLLLVGSREVIKAIYDKLTPVLLKKAVTKRLDLSKGEHTVHKDIMELFVEGERESERELWEKIRSEYLRGGLGVVGLDDVLNAALDGRIDEMIVLRDYKPEGRYCRDCENLIQGAPQTCPVCHSDSLFKVDVVNEIVEMLKLTGATVDFADPIPTLEEAGKIAALLRY
jgi:peptide subunit release factor 1 (eRF1)